MASLILGGLCAAIVALDLLRRPQHMWIMNVVWPLCALFGGVWIVWQYGRYGRATPRSGTRASADGRPATHAKRATPFPIAVANGTLHCGSGCALGDLLAELLVLLSPAVVTWFGWPDLFHYKIFAVWIIEFVFAFALGVVFQYFTIAPMRGLALGAGLRAALKADTLSLSAWQLGMYGFMAIAYFHWFRDQLHTELAPPRPEFWFMMQLAMICGFATAYPVNWWLIKRGIKERM